MCYHNTQLQSSEFWVKATTGVAVVVATYAVIIMAVVAVTYWIAGRLELAK